MYSNGFCPTDADGTKLPCPDGYGELLSMACSRYLLAHSLTYFPAKSSANLLPGAILGTGAITAILLIILAFVPPRILLRIFPPIVTGPTVTLIGVKLIQSGFKNWMGGTGPCSSPSTAVDFFERCPDISAPNALPWGSPEYFGLGFSVFVTIILCERFGSPMMKSCSVIVGLLGGFSSLSPSCASSSSSYNHINSVDSVGCVIAASTGYFDRAGIENAPAASFIWTHTFKLSLYGPLVLPLMAVYIIWYGVSQQYPCAPRRHLTHKSFFFPQCYRSHR